MKIKEVIERECCEDKDLQSFDENSIARDYILYCKYCGQFWFQRDSIRQPIKERIKLENMVYGKILQ